MNPLTGNTNNSVVSLEDNAQIAANMLVVYNILNDESTTGSTSKDVILGELELAMVA